MSEKQIDIAGLGRIDATAAGFARLAPDSATAARLGALPGMAVGDGPGTTYELDRIEQAPYPETAGFVRVAFRLALWHCVHWRDALVDVASRGGDADTNAAIVGALLGARDGVHAIPGAWIDRVLGATQPGRVGRRPPPAPSPRSRPVAVVGPRRYYPAMASLHGREADVALLDDTLASARAGRGRALFLTGEAGIGKSSVLAEARPRAGDMRVLAGAAWESGGAPPYWPWMQLLRGAADALGARVQELPGADRIAELVPGWSMVAATGVASGASAAADPAAARFALLDAIVRALVALSRERPLVLLLDDLHAADLPSLDVLVMLLRELPAASIAVIGAWREGELALRPDAAQRLARAARSGVVQPLRRLTADEVASWVGADAPAIFESSEGNPLFVEELLRAKKGGGLHGLEATLGDHLALVSAETRELLAIASIAGREIDRPVLSELVRRGDAACRDATGADDAMRGGDSTRASAVHDDDSLERAMRDATAAGVVEKRGEMWRFRHVLLRDHLYESLAASRRTALHRALGEILEKTDAARAAHHLLSGVETAAVAPRAIAVTRRAAAQASRVYAFEDAAELLTKAARVAETAAAQGGLAPGAASLGQAAVDVLEVRLELAQALHAAGLNDRARAQCVEIAAASGDDADRLARCAMIYAAELVSGRRDQTMIDLLDRALDAQAAGDSPTRARLMGRLAAALVPEIPQDRNPQQLAREAIAMARRIGDDETTMYVLKFSAHAFGFRMSVWESMQIARDVIAFSDKLGRPLEALEHRSWLIGGELAMGNLAASHAALDALTELLAPLRQPHYRWRIPILRAVHALARGDFNDADRLVSSVEELAREYDLTRAYMAAAFTRLALIDATRSPKRAQQALPTIRRLARIIGTVVSDAILAFVETVAGDRDAARARLTPEMFDVDIVLLQFGAEAILTLELRELAGVAARSMLGCAKLHPLLHGPAGSAVMRPVDVVAGELLLMVDSVDDAIAAIERGLVLARAIESPPFIASGAAALARALDRRAQPGDRERAVAFAAEAQQLTAQCSLETRALPLAEPAPPKPDNSLVLVSQGVIAWRGKHVALPASKGGEYLATLIAARGRDVHVSDLVGDDDRGDAGDVLDAKARVAYKQRAEELSEELETARARNDLGRAERISLELESITDELLAATGLGGRTRKAGSRVERARVNVQRRIKDAIRRLTADDEALGRYLDVTVRTGTFCSFAPIDA